MFKEDNEQRFEALKPYEEFNRAIDEITLNHLLADETYYSDLELNKQDEQSLNEQPLNEDNKDLEKFIELMILRLLIDEFEGSEGIKETDDSMGTREADKIIAEYIIIEQIDLLQRIGLVNETFKETFEETYNNIEADVNLDVFLAQCFSAFSVVDNVLDQMMQKGLLSYYKETPKGKAYEEACENKILYHIVYDPNIIKKILSDII